MHRTLGLAGLLLSEKDGEVGGWCSGHEAKSDGRRMGRRDTMAQGFVALGKIWYFVPNMMEASGDFEVSK